MEKYNYYSEVRNDVRKYIINNYTQKEMRNKLLMSTREEIEQELWVKLWTEDSVTGNNSGSYWFNKWKAEEALCHNIELLGEALNEFGNDFKDLQKGAEWADVCIRCYLLSQSIDAVLNEIEETL